MLWSTLPGFCSVKLTFLDLLDMPILEQCAFPYIWRLFQKWLPRPIQTTMLTRSASKFCVEPRSPLPNISHHNSKTIGKPQNIVSCSECQPEFLDDAADDDAPTIFPSDQTPSHRAQGWHIPLGNPSLWQRRNIRRMETGNKLPKAKARVPQLCLGHLKTIWPHPKIQRASQKG